MHMTQKKFVVWTGTLIILLLMPLYFICLLSGWISFIRHMFFHDEYRLDFNPFLWFLNSQEAYYMIVFPVLAILTACFLQGCFWIRKSRFKASMYFSVPLFSVFFVIVAVRFFM